MEFTERGDCLYSKAKAIHAGNGCGKIERRAECEMKRKKGVGYELKRNAFLYSMCVPGLILILVFSYIPMGGLIMAFQNYSLKTGLKSPWTGWSNFKFLIQSDTIFQGMATALKNTLLLNTLFIFGTTVVSVVLAIAFSEIKSKKYGKLIQSISILPYFMSWTVIALILDVFINPSTGILGSSPVNYYTNTDVWPPLLVFMKIWQGAGYSAIVYLATITGMDQEMLEAAEIDGASRLKKIWHITLPVLRPTVILMTLFSVGRIFNGDFGMIYALIGDKSALFASTDVIDTFVYRMMRQMQRYDLTTAIGLLQSVAGTLFVVAANAVAKRVEPDSAIF